MPGGVVEPLSSGCQAEISRKFPSVPLDRVNRTVEEYRIYRAHQADAPTSKDVRKEIDQIIEQANSLHLTLKLISEEAEDYLWLPAYTAGLPNIVHHVCSDLDKLMHISKLAFNETPKPQRGRQPALEGSLVRNLAHILRRSGLDANATPNGSLCQLAAMVLKDARKNVADVPDLVKRALRENRQETS